jgi:hypothetical protein
MVDEPKPAIVPTISEKNPIIMKEMSASSTSAYQSIECKLIVLNYTFVIQKLLSVNPEIELNK